MKAVLADKTISCIVSSVNVSSAIEIIVLN